MGLTCSYGVLHTGNLTWRLKSSSLTRLEINCEKYEGSDTFTCNQQLATIFANPAFVSAAWQCFFYSRVFFDCVLCNVSLGQNGLSGGRVFSLCLLILFFSPLPIRLQNKESNLGIWSPLTAFGCRSDFVQMSFRTSFRSPGISKRPLEKGG